jgi:NAD(P)-dependent dehydrogenase (short-subunit alcohol dehydrogenase family)
MQDIVGKVDITGAASGIGKGIAFVAAKMKVVLSDIERHPRRRYHHGTDPTGRSRVPNCRVRKLSLQRISG